MIPAPRPHGNQRSSEPRVRLCGGPWIDAATMNKFTEWHQAGVPYGDIIDRLTAYAVATKFSVVTKKKNRATPKNAPGSKLAGDFPKPADGRLHLC